MADEPELQQGNQGEWVTYLQQLLQYHGHTQTEINGQFSPALTQVVQDFQKAHGLPANGVVNRDTWDALTSTKRTVPVAQKKAEIDPSPNRDDGPVRPYPGPDPNPEGGPDDWGASATFDRFGKPALGVRTKGGEAKIPSAGSLGELKKDDNDTKSGPTQYGHLPAGQAATTPVTVDANRMFPRGDGNPGALDNSPDPEDDDNRAALNFLRQNLDHLALASVSEDVASRIMSVYQMVNHVVHGPHSWDPSLQAEFEAWLPYAVSSDAPEYQIAKETVHQAGEAVYLAALTWSKENPRQRITSAQDAGLADPVLGFGSQLRQSITAAIEQVQTTNEDALGKLRQAIQDLTDATDPATIIRNAGTVYSMVSNLLHGEDAMDPALADEEQAWIGLTPNDDAITAKDPLVTAVQAFFDSAYQHVIQYPYHALRSWDGAPTHDLLQAGHAARAAIATQ